MNNAKYNEILDFFFPENTSMSLEGHAKIWQWRVRGGADQEIIEKYTDLTLKAASGELQDWTSNPLSRLALIILLDQFSRSIWKETPKAFAQDELALEICLEGFKNGHFDALNKPWFKLVYQLPLIHCENANHIKNIEHAIKTHYEVAKASPEHLKSFYLNITKLGNKNLKAIKKFGRFPHRNEILGRKSTPEELGYLKEEQLAHQTSMMDLMK